VLRVALTGGIASGKTTCLKRFGELGAPTIDADALAHSALQPGTSGLTAVVDRFGPSLLGTDGNLDRAALARIVFSNPAARRAVEAIVHPLVYAAIQAWFDNRDSKADGPRIGIADIPLLYETGREKDFDRVIAVICPREEQISRVMARDRLSREEAEARLHAQWPLEMKRTRAHEVIDTSHGLAPTMAAVDQIWEKLRLV
jgi:dephospho-CoA kinase